jgi:hypothetical protein
MEDSRHTRPADVVLVLSSGPASGERASRPETRPKRGERLVHGDKELLEKLGRNDPCPCESGRRFQAMLHARWWVLTAPRATTTSANSEWVPHQRARLCRRGESGKRSRSRTCVRGSSSLSVGTHPPVTCGWSRSPSVKRALARALEVRFLCHRLRLRSSIGQSKRLLPVRFQVQLLAEAPVLIARCCSAPTCLAFIQETVGWNPTRATTSYSLPAWRNGRRTTFRPWRASGSSAGSSPAHAAVYVTERA